MAHIEIGGVAEEVILPQDFPAERAREVLSRERICVVGYGPQGQAQSLNLRGGGYAVTVCQRKGGAGWNAAQRDGWAEGKDLFDRLDDIVPSSTLIAYLLSDAGQSQQWQNVKPLLGSGAALVFAHGFVVVFSEKTGVVPPENVDTLLVAPKGAASTLRQNFIRKKASAATVNVRSNATGRGFERGLAYARGIGAAVCYPSTFENEVYLDLVGERGVLLGAVSALMKAQYDVLRAHKHSPVEAFNESVEEATQSLYPLIGEKGIDWLFTAASATAQRGALDWQKKFESALKPLFEELYQSVISGKETDRVLETLSLPDYREQLSAELSHLAETEMWKAGKVIRSFRDTPL